MLSSLMVGLGGFIGANLRYWLGVALAERINIPATFFINIAGALLIGILSGWAAKYNVNAQAMLFLKVGLCGGFTTFSTFSLESLQMLQEGKITLALAYMAASVILCVLAVYIGENMVR